MQHAYISQDANIRVHTSGIKYSKSLENALAKGKAVIIVSVDSGTKELYKSIKFVDKFDIVCENIKKYVSVLTLENKENVRLKYVITPGYNDYMIYKAEKLGIKYDIYSFLSYVLNERKCFRYKNLLKIKFLYKLITSFYRLTNLHKNFKYAFPTNNMIER